MQKVIVCTDLKVELRQTLEELQPDKIFILTDSHTHRLCLPLLTEVLSADVEIYTIEAGEEHKNIDSLSSVWKLLSDKQASRHSLMINLGGGMITDLGGFAAATFKRGIRYINMPTSLLGTVDAAVGGKTGIDFNGLKNEVGAFFPADAVLIDTRFYQTLDTANLLSGFAEMLKHSLLESEECLRQHLSFKPEDPDTLQLHRLVEQSIAIKQRIVSEDPYEKGIRKALNLGHTCGHALESLFLEQGHPVLHGYAVAWGMVCEIYLSRILCQAPSHTVSDVTRYIRQTFGPCRFSCNDYDYLYQRMLHDKKNISSGVINFTLLSAPGQIQLNQTATREQIYEALDYLREG